MSRKIQGGEHPISVACRLRGMTISELCMKIRMSPLEMDQFLKGIRKPDEVLTMRLAEVLMVREEYLRGRPRTISLWDKEEGMTIYCSEIIRSREAEGTFCVAEKPDGTVVCVFSGHGRTMVTDCPIPVPENVLELRLAQWTDEFGRPTAF